MNLLELNHSVLELGLNQFKIETQIMRFKIFTVFLFVILNFCHGQDWLLQFRQDFNNLNETYFLQKSYINTGLKLEPHYSFTPSHLSTMKIDFLGKFPNLEKLTITQYNFDTIEKIQSGMKLKQLTLWKNRFKRIHENSFEDLENLEYIDLAENNLVN